MRNRNLWILFLCQCFAVSASIVMVTLGGIVGGELADNAALATLPISLMIVGTALSTVPAAMLMKAIGRPAGFALAAGLGACGTLLAAFALRHTSFVMFSAGLMLVGVNLAFVQQYRFAAAESVGPQRVSQAISLVLLGSVGGALLGPELVARGQHWAIGENYVGTMYALAALLGVSSVMLLALRKNTILVAESGAQPGRRLREIVRQPVFLVAMLGGVVAYGVMTFIMTATPVSMHVLDGHSMPHTASVIRSHVIAMYAPSLFSGLLIARLGIGRMMAAGAVAMLGTVLVGLQGQAVTHYWLALVLLGIGWNFLYVGGTTLLTRCYRTSERFRSQAVNDFSVFATSATGSLLAGTAIHLLGWLKLVLVVIPPLLLMLLALAWIRGRPELGTAGDSHHRSQAEHKH